MVAPITHRCDGKISPGGGWCGEADKVDCPAFRRADGTIEKNIECGEPCPWVMGKSGYGHPPWQAVDGVRCEPAAPDVGFE
jgi:hypothetical protein